jgi:NAD(P)-dependent dehydrogenase (short-subunit alcohol dehydrogenase family)
VNSANRQRGGKTVPITIEGSRALVTGANRGLGRAFAEALLARGAATVYAGARKPATVQVSGAVPVELDITRPMVVSAVVDRCRDIDILINNAGVMRFVSLLHAPDTSAAEQAMMTNYLGTLRMCRAFAPVLKANGGGALVNVLSAASWVATPLNSTYCASKAAQWSLTNAARLELRSQGTLVTGVFAGLIDTEMVAGIEAPKVSPRSVAKQTLDAIEAGEEEVLADDIARNLKAALPEDLTKIYHDMADWAPPPAETDR